MNFETIQNGAVTHLILKDNRLDAAQAIPFKECVRAIADDGVDYILLDMTAVEFMDSSGLGALVSVMKYMGIDVNERLKLTRIGI